jgi:hypothetical protein
MNNIQYRTPFKVTFTTKKTHAHIPTGQKMAQRRAQYAEIILISNNINPHCKINNLLTLVSRTLVNKKYPTPSVNCSIHISKYKIVTTCTVYDQTYGQRNRLIYSATNIFVNWNF